MPKGRLRFSTSWNKRSQPKGGGPFKETVARRTRRAHCFVVAQIAFEMNLQEWLRLQIQKPITYLEQAEVHEDLWLDARQLYVQLAEKMLRSRREKYDVNPYVPTKQKRYSTKMQRFVDALSKEDE